MKKKVVVKSVSQVKKKSVKKDFSEESRFRAYALMAIIVLLIFLSYQIIKPYLIVLISSFVLAYLCRPIFNFLKLRFGKSVSAIICMILVLLMLVGPVAVVVGTLASQASDTIRNTEIMSVVDKLATLPLIDKLNIDWENKISQAGSYILSLVGTIASAIPSMLISALVFLFSFFYILVGWDYVVRQLKRFIPFKEKDRVVGEINSATHGIIFGYFFIALLDFIISAVGLYFAGVQFYILLSFLVAIFVFIPGLGPSLVSVPLLVYYALIGNWYSFTVILITWGIIAIFVETFLSSKILAGRARIHPLVMLIGILGGTTLFGIFGFIIGPLILVYTIRLVKELFRKD